MHKILTLLTIVLFISCQPDSKPNNQTTFIPETVDFSEKDRKIIEDYLVEKKLEANRTESGLFYMITEEGTGDKPTPKSAVRVKYTGYLLDGTTFDTSPEDGIVFDDLSGLIKGFSEGLLLLNKGAKATFIIPSGLAYGNRGAGRSIPPNTVIAFDVELLGIL